jgi:hypothetical protein
MGVEDNEQPQPDDAHGIAKLDTTPVAAVGTPHH